jgi:hypothetical protein
VKSDFISLSNIPGGHFVSLLEMVSNVGFVGAVVCIMIGCLSLGSSSSSRLLKVSLAPHSRILE